MDITFRLTEGTFNFRVAAIMIHEGKLLIMKSSDAPYWYIPGGRVHLQERAEAAILRELQEELEVCPNGIRPLWMVQDFYNEDVNHQDYHELGLYFLADVENTQLLARGEEFYGEEEGKSNIFRWTPFEELKDLYLYPLFIKEEIFRLPEQLQLITEIR